jgi:hypothetical protein
MKSNTAAIHVLALITLFLLGTGEDALGAPGATIGLNFTGANQRLSGIDRPDANGAVGPHHIVEMINGVYTVYDRATGQLLQRMSLNDFWRAAGKRGGGIVDGSYDPRTVYDPTEDRWYAVGLEGAGAGMNLAVSISGDPTFPIDDLTRGWSGFILDGDPASEPDKRWADYPGFGFDADGVYVTAQLLNLDTSLPVRRDYMVVSLPKADLLSTTPTIANRSVYDLAGDSVLAQCAAIILQPVVDVGPSDGRASFYSANGTLGMQRWDVTNAGVPVPGGATLSGPTQITIKPFTRAPGGKQPENARDLSSFTTGSPSYGRVCPSGELRDYSKFNAALVRQGDPIWGAHAVDANGRAAIRWYELDAKTGAVRQEGTVTDPNLDLLYPSIAVNSLGDVVIGFTATGENKFPSAYAVVGDTVGGVTTFGDLMELKAGNGTFYDGEEGDPRNFWGDYTATVADPNDPYSFWTFQEFTQANNQWAVQVTQILLPGAAPRTDVIALGPSAAYVVRDNAVNGNLDDLGDASADASGGFLQRSIQVGETDTTSTNRLDRFLAKFELPDRGADASDRLQSALLRVTLEGIEGTPAGPLSLLHSLSDNDLDRLKSDYEDASYRDTGLDVVQPTDAIGRYYELDVTDLVRDDYSQDGATPLSAFRLQINDASFLEDGLSNRYVLTSAGTGRPELLLTFLLAGDLNGNGVLDIGDIDDLTVQSAGGNNPPKYDLNADTLVNSLDVNVWVKDLFETWIGDANLDREFSSTDLVAVLASGTYEANLDSVWSTGDFDGDGRTNSSDLVAALADGGYEQGPRTDVAAVPEPTPLGLLLFGCVAMLGNRRTLWRNR